MLPDIVDRETRSRMMSGIRSGNTKPELAIRRGLHAMGFRFRLHTKHVSGTPDLLLPKYKAAILVHGCFWHGHDCSLFRMPGSRTEFWSQKITRNRERDQTVSVQLLSSGWRPLTIWECAMRGPGKLGELVLMDSIAQWLRGTDLSGELRGAQ